MSVVAVVVLTLLVVAELLVEVLGPSVEFASMEMWASVIVELLGPAPNVKREPTEGKANIC